MVVAHHERHYLQGEVEMRKRVAIVVLSVLGLFALVSCWVNTPSPTKVVPVAFHAVEAKAADIKVPSFLGLKPADAELVAKGAGLELGQSFVWTTPTKKEDGRVIAQTPKAGERVDAGYSLQLVYGKY